MDIDHLVEEAKLRDDTIIDVRTPEEYDSGHIPGAINIPLNECSKVRLDPDRQYELYCLSGRRAQVAQTILKERGYHVENIGGIEDWNGKLAR
ncbi:rhodanese-like domain-containing protein [uncultured Dubosiella sp.]|uniref:rhodanese-like domain-containing protein n=1 Tax=uncultured Dubosiella sp. TaxID=1937011 RepID=UPI0025929804|nr:rhodanese-like domain-containing protein [uncultured Dubosiella sp.]